MRGLSRVGIFKNAKNEETTYDYEYSRSQEVFVVIEKTPAPFRRRIERQYDLRGRLLSEENGTAMQYERRRDGPLIDALEGLVAARKYPTYLESADTTHQFEFYSEMQLFKLFTYTLVASRNQRF